MSAQAKDDNLTLVNISGEAYAEIKRRLQAQGLGHRISVDVGTDQIEHEYIETDGLAFAPAEPSTARLFLVYPGGKVISRLETAAKRPPRKRIGRGRRLQVPGHGRIPILR